MFSSNDPMLNIQHAIEDFFKFFLVKVHEAVKSSTLTDIDIDKIIITPATQRYSTILNPTLKAITERDAGSIKREKISEFYRDASLDCIQQIADTLAKDRSKTLEIYHQHENKSFELLYAIIEHQREMVVTGQLAKDILMKRPAKKSNRKTFNFASLSSASFGGGHYPRDPSEYHPGKKYGVPYGCIWGHIAENDKIEELTADNLNTLYSKIVIDLEQGNALENNLVNLAPYIKLAEEDKLALLKKPAGQSLPFKEFNDSPFLEDLNISLDDGIAICCARSEELDLIFEHVPINDFESNDCLNVVKAYNFKNAQDTIATFLSKLEDADLVEAMFILTKKRERIPRSNDNNGLERINDSMAELMKRFKENTDEKINPVNIFNVYFKNVSETTRFKEIENILTTDTDKLKELTRLEIKAAFNRHKYLPDELITQLINLASEAIEYDHLLLYNAFETGAMRWKYQSNYNLKSVIEKTSKIFQHPDCDFKFLLDFIAKNIEPKTLHRAFENDADFLAAIKTTITKCPVEKDLCSTLKTKLTVLLNTKDITLSHIDTLDFFYYKTMTAKLGFDSALELLQHLSCPQDDKDDMLDQRIKKLMKTPLYQALLNIVLKSGATLFEQLAVKLHLLPITISRDIEQALKLDSSAVNLLCLPVDRGVEHSLVSVYCSSLIFDSFAGRDLETDSTMVKHRYLKAYQTDMELLTLKDKNFLEDEEKENYGLSYNHAACNGFYDHLEMVDSIFTVGHRTPIEFYLWKFILFGSKKETLEHIATHISKSNIELSSKQVAYLFQKCLDLNKGKNFDNQLETLMASILKSTTIAYQDNIIHDLIFHCHNLDAELNKNTRVRKAFKSEKKSILSISKSFIAPSHAIKNPLRDAIASVILTLKETQEPLQMAIKKLNPQLAKTPVNDRFKDMEGKEMGLSPFLALSEEEEANFQQQFALLLKVYGHNGTFLECLYKAKAFHAIHLFLRHNLSDGPLDDLQLVTRCFECLSESIPAIYEEFVTKEIICKAIIQFPNDTLIHGLFNTCGNHFANFTQLVELSKELKETNIQLNFLMATLTHPSRGSTFLDEITFSTIAEILCQYNEFNPKLAERLFMGKINRIKDLSTPVLNDIHNVMKCCQQEFTGSQTLAKFLFVEHADVFVEKFSGDMSLRDRGQALIDLDHFMPELAERLLFPALRQLKNPSEKDQRDVRNVMMRLQSSYPQSEALADFLFNKTELFLPYVNADRLIHCLTSDIEIEPRGSKGLSSTAKVRDAADGHKHPAFKLKCTIIQNVVPTIKNEQQLNALVLFGLRDSNPSLRLRLSLFTEALKQLNYPMDEDSLINAAFKAPNSLAITTHEFIYILHKIKLELSRFWNLKSYQRIEGFITRQMTEDVFFAVIDLIKSSQGLVDLVDNLPNFSDYINKGNCQKICSSMLAHEDLHVNFIDKIAEKTEFTAELFCTGVLLELNDHLDKPDLVDKMSRLIIENYDLESLLQSLTKIKEEKDKKLPELIATVIMSIADQGFLKTGAGISRVVGLLYKNPDLSNALSQQLSERLMSKRTLTATHWENYKHVLALCKLYSDTFNYEWFKTYLQTKQQDDIHFVKALGSLGALYVQEDLEPFTPTDISRLTRNPNAFCSFGFETQLAGYQFGTTSLLELYSSNVSFNKKACIWFQQLLQTKIDNYMHAGNNHETLFNALEFNLVEDNITPQIINVLNKFITDFKLLEPKASSCEVTVRDFIVTCNFLQTALPEQLSEALTQTANYFNPLVETHPSQKIALIGETATIWLKLHTLLEKFKQQRVMKGGLFPDSKYPFKQLLLPSNKGGVESLGIEKRDMDLTDSERKDLGFDFRADAKVIHETDFVMM